MILRALWVAIGLHPQPFQEPRESYYAFRYFATMKDEETKEELARVDRRGLLERFGTALELWR
jgi:hypothetical protein